MDFLHREEAPFGKEVWEKIDELVIKTARETLVGRKFIEITVAPDPSVQSLPYDILDTGNNGACGVFGDKECEIVKVKERKFLPIPQIYKDFKLHWRDIEANKRFGMPIDLSVAAAAAREVSKAEDILIFNGDSSLGYPGLLNVEGRSIVEKENFNEDGGVFKTAVKCVEKLVQNGFNGNFAFILNPKDFSKGFRLYGNSGNLEINHIKELFDAGVFSSYAVPEGKAVAVATGIENMDIFIAQDMITAYLAYENMEHFFRVFEILALRIKNPTSVCVAK